MSHLTMFKYATNDKGVIQVVIGSEDKAELEALGFVDSIDKVKAPTTRKVKKDA